jgi:hypothetical protein
MTRPRAWGGWVRNAGGGSAIIIRYSDISNFLNFNYVAHAEQFTKRMAKLSRVESSIKTPSFSQL